MWCVGLQSERGLLTPRAFLVMWPEHPEAQSCHLKMIWLTDKLLLCEIKNSWEPLIACGSKY